MRNKYLNILAGLLLAGSLGSCSDFLDRYPQEELSDQSFWKTYKDAEMAVSELYNVLPTWDVDEDIKSDNATHGIKWAAGNVSKGVYLPGDFSWSYEYGVIRKANLVLSKLNDVEMTEDQRKTLKAQACFFRAYVYFTLIRQYGDVPYLDKPVNLTDVDNITRTPWKDVYDKVMKDFDTAINGLPKEWPEEYGRITEGAARAMKARAALYFNEWNTALQEAKAVMDLNQYELYDKDNTGKYKELFWEKTDGCEEIILAVQYNAPTKTHYLIGWECFPDLGWGGLNPTQSLVDAFETKDGAPIGPNNSLYNPQEPFKNRDPRLEVNILHDGETIYGKTIKVAPLPSSGFTGIAQHGDATETGYYQQKWLDPSIDPQGAGWNMGKDWTTIRFAEVLLTYAEAKNELSPLDQTAFDAVNRVRKRVGMPKLQKTDPTEPTYCGTQEDLRQRIRNEWRVEFALEGGKRQWDIRRWGIAKDVLNAPFRGLNYKIVDNPNPPKDDKDNGKMCILYQGEHIVLPGSHYEDHNYVYPIPQTERELNKGLTQNQGYPGA